MPDKFDLNVIRIALEHASFSDYRVRDSVNTLIKSVESDLEEVGFESSENTNEVVAQLEELISEIEAPRKERATPFELKEDDVDVREVQVINNDDEEPKTVINVDDELDEFDPPQ